MSQGWPESVACVQPGGGLAVAWQRCLRRWRHVWLRTVRGRYLAACRARRGGECVGCQHVVHDAHDLVWVRNVCGWHWPAAESPSPFRDRLGLVRLGRPELFALLLVGGGIAAIACLSWPWAAALGIVPPAFGAWFFRDPQRRPPERGEVESVLAPADGVLDDVRTEADCPFFAGPAVRLGIYLSVFDVHVQRTPITGQARAFAYRRGDHAKTARTGHTDDNEQLATTFAAADGTPVVVRQIAGPFARRICNVLRAGEGVLAGQRFGLIKFGSRCELWLPAARVRVVATRGARVRAGETVLAHLTSRGTATAAAQLSARDRVLRDDLAPQ